MIKLLLLRAGNGCLRSCTHVCSLTRSSRVSHVYHFSCILQGCQPLGAPWHVLQESTCNLCRHRVRPLSQPGNNLPCTCDAVVPTCSSTQVAPVPPRLLLAREVGQNTRVGPAQTITASDGAERSQSCFILLVFLASLRSKRERQGCSQHREWGENREPSLYLLRSPGASM